MKDFLGLGLLAVGGYLLYNWMNQAASAAAASGTPITTTGQVGNQAATAPPITSQGSSGGNSAGDNNQPVAHHQGTGGNPVTSATLKTQMLALSGMGANNTYNADQWGYYYNQIRTPLTGEQFGAAFTNPDGGDRTVQYTVDQWISRLQGIGLGLSGIFGLGRSYPAGFGTGRVIEGGMGRIGQGYNINATFSGGASKYELAEKFVS